MNLETTFPQDTVQLSLSFVDVSCLLCVTIRVSRTLNDISKKALNSNDILWSLEIGDTESNISDLRECGPLRQRIVTTNQTIFNPIFSFLWKYKVSFEYRLNKNNVLFNKIMNCNSLINLKGLMIANIPNSQSLFDFLLKYQSIIHSFNNNKNNPKIAKINQFYFSNLIYNNANNNNETQNEGIFCHFFKN